MKKCQLFSWTQETTYLCSSRKLMIQAAFQSSWCFMVLSQFLPESVCASYSFPIKMLLTSYLPNHSVDFDDPACAEKHVAKCKHNFQEVQYIHQRAFINSLAPGRFKKKEIRIRKIILKLILATDGCEISSEIALRWPSLDSSDDKSTLFQVMAWCHQATSHYHWKLSPDSIDRCCFTIKNILMWT